MSCWPAARPTRRRSPPSCEAHQFPLNEGLNTTFVYRGEADEVRAAPLDLRPAVFAAVRARGRHRSVVPGPASFPAARASSTSSRSSGARAAGGCCGIRSTRTWRTTRSAPTRCSTAAATRPRTGPRRIPTPGPARSEKLSVDSRHLGGSRDIQLYLPPRFRTQPALSAAGRPRRPRLPAVLGPQDGARQPDPPARDRADDRRPDLLARPAGGVRRRSRATPPSSPRSWCRRSKRACRSTRARRRAG